MAVPPSDRQLQSRKVALAGQCCQMLFANAINQITLHPICQMIQSLCPGIEVKRHQHHVRAGEWVISAKRRIVHSLRVGIQPIGTDRNRIVTAGVVVAEDVRRVSISVIGDRGDETGV